MNFILILHLQIVFLAVNLTNVGSFKLKKEWINQILLPQPKDSIFSCLEKKYESVANYLNCHIFCPSCNQGFGKCVNSGGQKLCVCECQYPVQLHKECPSVRKYCRNEIEFEFEKFRNSDIVLRKCKDDCSALGFSDGALCGLDDDSPIIKSTCTCLCPKLSID